MTDTEHLLPWQQHQAIRDKLAQMPAGLDSATGKTDIDRAADAAIIARVTAPEPVADDGPQPMHPNRA